MNLPPFEKAVLDQIDEYYCYEYIYTLEEHLALHKRKTYKMKSQYWQGLKGIDGIYQTLAKVADTIIASKKITIHS